MSFAGKRILVTGASGFVGKNLVVDLKSRGAEVLTLTDPNGYRIDVRDWQRIRELGGGLGKVDLVYHLAALMFVPYSFENPREIYEVNVLGTLNILELCRLHSVDKVIFASSYIYGPPQYLPIDETHPINPTNPYSRSKALGEELCCAYYEDYGLKCVILRAFNIYGAGQRDNFLIPTILRQIATGEIELKDPEPRRDFLYVKDAVEAYIKAADYSGSGFEVFNIGLGKSYSVDEIVTKIFAVIGREVKVRYLQQRRKGEIMNTVADITKAKEKLSWEPEFNLEEGLTNMIAKKGDFG